MRHSGKRGRKVDKKLTKSDVGEGFATKKCEASLIFHGILSLNILVTYFQFFDYFILNSW